MTGFWGVTFTELRLQWRSRTLWATVALTLLYTIPGSAETYFAAVRSFAGSFITFAPLGLSLIWVASARRPERCGNADLVESSPLPRSVRLAAEVIGSLLALVMFALLIVGLDTTVHSLLQRSDIRGLPRDMALSGLLIAPPLLAWLGLARLIGRLLPLAAGYVTVALLWGAGLFAGTLLPISAEWSLAYMPLGSSDLTLFGANGGRLLLNRGVLAGIGALAILLSCFPGRQGRRWVRTAAPLLLGTVALLLLTVIPGVKAVKAVADLPESGGAWEVRARWDPRWQLISTDLGDALVADHHVPWAAPLMEAIGQVRALSGTSTDSSSLTVVEAPVREPLSDNGRYVIPERTFRRLTSRERLMRRVITLEVARQSGEWPEAGTRWSSHVSRGIVMYTEWCYVDMLLGREVAREEINAWQGMLEQLTSRRQATSVVQPPGPAAGLRPDPDTLSDWRGDDLVGSEIAYQTALGLWEHFAFVKPAELSGLTERWVNVIRNASPEATGEEILSRLTEAAQ